MNFDDLLTYIEFNQNCEWWFKAALDAVNKGYYKTITERDNDDLYLARFWLNTPEYSKEKGREKEFDSANSTMLHYFVRPDTDKALHDHPWDFSTTILSGSYHEHLPTYDWFKGPKILGPGWGENIVVRVAGQTIAHKNTDLHCIGWVEKNTWTLVTTKDRNEVWGFHPKGERWVDYKTYLNSKKQVMT